MALQEFGISIVLGGVLASSFKSSFKGANTSLAQMRNNIKQMDQTKLDMKQYKELAKDTKKNEKALYKLSTSLKKAGIDVKSLDKDSRQFRMSLIKLKKASKIQIKIEGIKNKFQQEKAAIIGLGAAVYGMSSIVSSANNVLKSQGEIKSLGIAKEGIDSITKAGNEMSLQFGQITAPEFIKASYDIKSGIASLTDEGVKNMTKMAAVTAVATKSSTQEMTKLYALGYGIFREDFSSDMDFGKKFSGAIAGAVQAFRTDGSDLSQGISNIGASAKAMGVSLEEELAIVGLSKSAFNSASEAGSGYRAFLDGVGKAQEELGLEFVDANGKMLPMVDILEKIKDKYGDLDVEEIDSLKKGFGSSEAVKIITALLPKTDALVKAQVNLRKSMDGGLSKAQEMAAAMDSGYGFEKMANAMSYMSFTIGKAVAPAVDMLATALGSMAKGIAWLDEKIPMLVPVLSGLTFGFIGVVVVVKSLLLTKLAYTFAVNTLKKAVLLQSAANNMSMLSFNRVGIATALSSAKTKTLAFWQGALAVKTKVATMASTLFRTAMIGINLAMAANPFGLLVVGIGAVVAGLVWAYRKFDWFREGISSIWGLVKTVFSYSPLGLVMNGWGKAFDYLSKKFEWFASAVDTFKSMGSTVGSWLGFGGEKQESPKSANNASFEPAKAMRKVVAVTAVATQLAVAQPTTVSPQMSKASSSNNSYNITVQVQGGNPTEIANEVKKAISQIETSRKNRSFNDEEI